MRAFRVLARLRGIRAPVNRPVVELALASGWTVLADEPGSELVRGAVGQPWRLRGGDNPGGDFAGHTRRFRELYRGPPASVEREFAA